MEAAEPSSSSSKSKSKASAKSKCHTAERGEPCFTDVIWAMTEGIISHKEWYADPCPNLDKSASFEVFQACVYKINHTKCGLPCNPMEKISQVDVAKGSVNKDDAEKSVNSEAQQHFCHTSMKGNKCYETVLKAMARVKAHPDDYPGLNESSPFEDFQKFLHEKKGEESSCPKPCACHTAVTGERCFEDVTWAMTEGVNSHQKWYVNLTNESTFEDFQTFLHKDSKLECPLPCQSVGKAHAGAAVPKPETTSTKPPAKPEAGADAETTTPKPETTTTTPGKIEAPCHTSVKGEDCYEHVNYALTKGIYEKPDWYEGLTRRSTFEDFQAVLHKNKKLRCPKPCECHTAQSGDKCMESIRWVLLEGLKVKPRWYPDLSPTSRFEEVQARLHEDANSSCTMPCQPAIFDTPSLFCYSLFRSSGYELDLAKFMVSHGWGIFNCDDFAVLSNKKLDLGVGIDTTIIPPCEVGVSKDGTAANTLMFMRVWDAILNDVRYRLHDWTVKVDPDAVMFPDRLRGKLKPYTGQSVYVKNCDKYTGEGWPMMFGSLEAFSKQAIQSYFDGAERCKNELEWQAWGEDLFMMKCLDHLGVGSLELMDAIGDNVCKGADCADGLKAAYHPFKSVEAWEECFTTAIR